MKRIDRYVSSFPWPSDEDAKTFFARTFNIDTALVSAQRIDGSKRKGSTGRVTFRVAPNVNIPEKRVMVYSFLQLHFSSFIMILSISLYQLELER